VIEVGPRPHRHHDFFERRVAGPLADAVDRAFDLARPVLDRGQAVGNREAQVVVAVRADRRLVDVRHAVFQDGDRRTIFLRRRVADGVGNIDRRRPRVDGRFDDLAEKITLGASGVLGRELHVVAVARGSLHALDRPLDDLLARHLELKLAVDGARGQEDVNPRFGRVLEGFPGTVDVGVVAAGQAADDRRTADRVGDFADRLEVAGRSDRKAGFDNIDAEGDEGLGDLHLLLQVHAAAGRLLAVAEGCVEDFDRAGLFSIGHGLSSLFGW
jgi:hypothetical protein